jgi:hypothetical protein
MIAALLEKLSVTQDQNMYRYVTENFAICLKG